MDKYIEAITRILEKNEEFEIDETMRLGNLQDDLEEIRIGEKWKNNIVREGKKYGLPEEIVFVNACEVTSRRFGTGLKDKKIYVFFKEIKEKLLAKEFISSRLDVEFIFLKKVDRRNFTIEIDTRLNSMFVKNSIFAEAGKTNSLMGELFVAKLVDLVEIYNQMGNALFDKNVRTGIVKDVNRVGIAIKETLRDEPENFWFYNNGITILAKSVDKKHRNSVEISGNEQQTISVINGAQTISTCAEFFYSENPDDKKIIENAKNNAYVLLRVIEVDSIDSQKYENRISIALNRQKPIDAEDLAYNSTLVSVINSMETFKPFTFKIARKGDDFEDENQYQLTLIGKMIIASKEQKPGTAKNMYSATLLKMEGSSFVKKEYLPELNGVDGKVNDDYIKKYGLVNFSSKLLKAWENDIKYIDKDTFKNITEDNKIMESGNYYFVALLTWALLGGEFGKKIVINNKEEIKKAITVIERNSLEIVVLFVSLMDQLAATERMTQDDLKKDLLYKNFGKYEMDLNVFRGKIQRLVTKEIDDSNDIEDASISINQSMDIPEVDKTSL